MPVAAKICGVNTPEAVKAAVDGGAAFVGFNYYPPSPRAVSPYDAAKLASHVPPSVLTVGVLVDPEDEWIDEILAAANLDVLQFHGRETPGRIADIKQRTNRKVIKAIPIANAGDLANADAYIDIADWLMFDAKPPKDMKNPLPGGNAVQFDWTLLAGRTWSKPWLLAGGLDANNVAAAVQRSGACLVDTSSGVEDSPGHKNPAKIRDFLNTVARL